MQGEQYTLKDLAKALNLSVSTVSRALRNHPDVNEITRKKVQEFAEAVEFQKNPLALSLLKHRTNAIGVIVPEIANYFFSQVIYGIQKVAYQSGYNVLICVSEESMEKEVAITRHLVNSRVDGLLVAISAETHQYDHFNFVHRKDIPLILMDRITDQVPASTISTNNYEASFEAVEYLIQTGCRRIAHIAGPKLLSVTNQRLQGYLDALRKHHLSPEKNWIQYGGFSQEDGINCTRILWESTPRPDAIFAINDRAAIGAMRFLKEKKILIPQEISVIGFNNNPMGEIIEPALSTVAQPQFEMGELAAKLLIEQIHQQAKGYTLQHLSLPSQLTIRKSTF
ncbi:MAG: LacI family DNA-binding transcriptional regulator [Microscillaceae bacterium]|nr:LacI family DNA-binding transcriptional regulator [Microscillaceae bacterium]